MRLALLVGSLCLLVAPNVVADQPSDADMGAPFLATPVGQSIQMVVPEKGPVVLLIHVTNGAAADLVLEGPGKCNGALSSLAVDAQQLRRSQIRADCGTLDSSNYVLRISARGVASGYMVGKGAFFLDSPSGLPERP